MTIKIDLTELTVAELAILCSMNIGDEQRRAALTAFKANSGILSKETAQAAHDAIEMIEETL